MKTKQFSTSAGDFNDFFIVGIGASAGGLKAFESFFSGIPANTNLDMAFVIVQHLDPNHKSLLTELISRYTTMEVYEVTEGLYVQKNCVYVIPPNHNMRLSNGVLHLVEPADERVHPSAVDFFLHSLALDKKNRAVGIILSGTGHDGSKGIKEIREFGGITFAQIPESCEYDGMPSSSIATGMIHYILTPQEMPQQLLVCANTYTLPETTVPYDKGALEGIFTLLQHQTSHDFSMYKINTIGRRIERRLLVNKIDTLKEYYSYLKKNDREIEMLFNDLLIGVTSFFRDPEVFISLEKNAIEKLLSEKNSGDTIRIWVPGCSTGEEPYSIGILFMEAMQKVQKRFSVQIFASDIDSSAIAIARAGVYPVSISENIPPERLKNYFTQSIDQSSYKINKNIRDMLIFSVHDLIKDPPFSRLDLISCRNLLIYMNAELQKKVLSLLHYALNKNGKLLLGSSESLGELSSLFTTLDSKSKLFESKKQPDTLREKMLSKLTATNKSSFAIEYVEKNVSNIKLPLRELTENAILEQIAPAAVLVNEKGDILYIHGRAGVYLELPSGETLPNNILTMAKEGLREDLLFAFHKAVHTKQITRLQGLHVSSQNSSILLNVTIRLVNFKSKLTQGTPLYLILLEEDIYATSKGVLDNTILEFNSEESDLDAKKHIQFLKQELKLQKEFLQDSNEKLETSNQELKLYNEEIQSINEELQSTNEELETSKEELQSVNEELSTVNSELNTKITDLSRSNNDMNNLLAGTGIGTIFVDHKLNILRFTPAVTRIVNLIQSDMGRPVGHIVSNLIDYNTLVDDVESVLETLIPKEIEVHTKEGAFYLLRIQPYRTLENVIEGAVISFVNITEMNSMKEKLKEADELSRLAIIVRDSSDAIILQNLDGKIIAWNPAAQKLYGWSEEEALGMNTKERIPPKLRDQDIKKINELSRLKALKVYKTERLNKDGSILNVHVILTILYNSNGESYAISTTERAQDV